MNFMESRALHGATAHIVFLLAAHPEKVWTRSELEDWCLYPDNAILKSLGVLKQAGYIVVHGNPKKPHGYQYGPTNPLNLPFRGAAEQDPDAGDVLPGMSPVEETDSNAGQSFGGAEVTSTNHPPLNGEVQARSGLIASDIATDALPRNGAVPSEHGSSSPRFGEVQVLNELLPSDFNTDALPRNGVVPSEHGPSSPRFGEVLSEDRPLSPRNGEVAVKFPPNLPEMGRLPPSYTIQEYRSPPDTLDLDTKYPPRQDLLYVYGTSYAKRGQTERSAAPDRVLLGELDYEDTVENRLLWLRAGGLNPKAKSTRALADKLDVETIAAHVLQFAWEILECRAQHAAGLLVTRLREGDNVPRLRCQDCLALIDNCLCGVIRR